MASDGGSRTVRVQHGSGGQALKLLVQNIRGDLNLLSNEAKKKHPAVREVCRLIILQGVSDQFFVCNEY